MTSKQKRFCEEYVVDNNATQAAIRTGYSEKTAYSTGQRLLKNVEVQNYIRELMEGLKSKNIADAQEICVYLTSVLRGEAVSEVIVTEGMGDGITVAKTMEKGPDEKEKLKAAELLGKRYGIFTEKMNIEGSQVIIVDDLEE